MEVLPFTACNHSQSNLRDICIDQWWGYMDCWYYSCIAVHIFSMVTSRVRWNEISRQHLSLRSINSNKTICFTEERTTLIQAAPYGLLCEKRPETSCNSAPRHPFITLRQMAQKWHICTNNCLKSWWCTAGGRPSCWPLSMIYAVHFQKLGH